MKFISKFNELNSTKTISNDRVTEIITELEVMTSKLNDTLSKSKSLGKELNEYKSNSKKSNNQIDDAFVNVESLSTKLRESLDIILSISTKLNDYNEKGEQFLY
jgi:peptidoglycan hydrolase CwlO-like protein